MNLKPFLKIYKESAFSGHSLCPSNIAGVAPELPSVIDKLGGRTFNNGVYRVFRGDHLRSAINAIESVFPEYEGRVIPFAYDWLGRHFALDVSGVYDRQEVLLMEGGAGEVMRIPYPIAEFHNNVLVESANDALASNAFDKWFAEFKTPLPPDKCVGYKIPLFLSGKDVFENMEICDIDVYVDFCGQLRAKVKDLPDGTDVKNILISD